MPSIQTDLGATDVRGRLRGWRSRWRAPVLLLTLALLVACSGVLEGDAATESPPATSESMPLVGKNPDVVLDLAESASGWTSSHTVRVSTERKEGSTSLETSGNGGGRFARSNLPPVDVRSMRHLTFWYYISDASKIQTDRDAQIEISSSSALDTEEMNWNVHSQGLRTGWNFVILQLPGSLRSKTSTPINLGAIKRFRIYHFVSSSVVTRIDDIRFTNREPNQFATGCANAAANRTLTGGGKFKQAAGYSATGCTDAHMVDVNDYAVQNTYGATVAYGDTLPPTQATCEQTLLTAGIWEMRGTLRVFLGEAVARGVWLKNPLDQGICRRPHLTLERHIPEFQPDGRRDFKLALRAESAGNKRRAVSFATHARRETSIYAWDQLRDEIAALGAGAIHPAVHKLWLRKGTGTGDLFCRTSQLDHTLMTFSTRSLTQLGATSASVSAKNDAYSAMRAALCTATGTEAALQTATRNFFSGLIQIRKDLANLHFASASALGGEFGDYQVYSTMLMSETMRHGLGVLTSNCNPSLTDMYRFGSTGVLPSGVAADRLLLGSCGNNSAGTVAVNLGVGGTLSPVAARTTLADCVAPEGRDVCDDPRAAGTQAEYSGTNALTDTDNCFVDGAPCTTPQADENQRRRVIIIVTNAQGEALDQEERQRLLNENPGAIEADLVGNSERRKEWRAEMDQPLGDEDTLLGRLGEAVIKDVDAFAEKVGFWHTLKQVVEEVINGLFVDNGPPRPPLPPDAPGCELNGTCHPAAYPCPGASGQPPDENCPPSDGTAGSSGTGGQYCPPDWAPGGWYGAANSNFSDGLAPRQLDQRDRIEHCLCQAMDPSYVATGTPSVRAAAMCPAKREQTAHHCLAAQWGPDDPIPPECLDGLQPAQIDNRNWMTRICQQIQCPDDRAATPMGDRCGCLPATTDLLGDPLGERCRQLGWAARCEEGVGCVCNAPDYGDLPYNDPSCRNDPTTFPGTLDRLVSPTPERLLVFSDPRSPNGRYLGLIDGSPTSSRVVSAVLPAFERVTMPAIGTGVGTQLMTTEATASGALQLYLHNPEQNVFHEFADQCELRTLVPGQAAACDLTPDNTQRRSKWNDCFARGGCAFELTLAGTPASFDGMVGFSAPTFNGTITTLPSPTVAACPRPTPDSFARDLSPLWQDLGGTPDAPNVDLTLGSGTTLKVPPSTFSIRPGLLPFANPG